MMTRVWRIGFLLAAVLLFVSPASGARADVWLFDVLTLRRDAAAYQAEAYVGALQLLARRHGGVRVASARETPGDPGHIVGLWRFRDTAALDALLADPSYHALGPLQERTFDPGASRSLERVRALAGGAE